MLNLTVVMLGIFSPLARAAALVAASGLLLWTVFSPIPARAQAPESTPTATLQPASIFAPAAGEALQGVVSIRGNSAAPGFQSAELAFAYQSDPTGSWFLIQQSSQPAPAEALASWDTTTITDGNYRLRLLVILTNGQVVESIVEGLRVRNYSPVETSTPQHSAPAIPAGVPPAGAPLTTARAPLHDYQPAAGLRVTPAPTNPAQITRADLSASAARGGLAAIGALLLAVGYMALRARLHR